MASNIDLINAKLSTYFFVTKYFHNPLDMTQAWNPYKNQIIIYNCVDRGYDFFSKVITPTKPAKILEIVGPRQKFGKSEGIASCAAALNLRYPDSYSIVANSDEKGAKLALRRMKNFIVRSDFKGQIRRETTDTLELENGSTIECFGQTENIRGRSATWCFVDEAALFTDTILTEVIIPTTTMAGAFRRFKTPDVILLSTPRSTQGVFYDFYRRGMEARGIGCRKCKTEFRKDEFKTVDRWDVRLIPLNMPNCPKCGFNDWEYVDNEICVFHVNPYDHPSITREQIERELALLGNTPAARQEVLGEFIAGASSVFHEEWLISCSEPTLYNIHNPIKGAKYIMSVDLGRSHDAVVFMLGHKQEATPYLDHIHYLPTEGGVEYEQIRYEFLAFIVHYKPYFLVPDATGIGDAVVERMERDIYDLQHTELKGFYHKSGRRVEWTIPQCPDLKTMILCNKDKISPKTGRRERLGFVFDVNSKFEIVQNAVNYLARGMCKIPIKISSREAVIFYEELINFGYEYSSNNNILYGVQNGHDDTVIAFCLLLWGLDRIPNIPYSAPQLGGEDHFILSDETLSRREIVREESTSNYSDR